MARRNPDVAGRILIHLGYTVELLELAQQVLLVPSFIAAKVVDVAPSKCINPKAIITVRKQPRHFAFDAILDLNGQFYLFLVACQKIGSEYSYV